MDTPTDLEEKWKETKRKLKQQFAMLADNDLLLEGKQEEILDKIEAKLGKSKQEIRQIIAEL